MPDALYFNIKGQALQVLATLDGNAASFFVPSSVCDSVKDWNTFQILKSHDGLETALVVGGFRRFDGV
jgi:hypothetical protein